MKILIVDDKTENTYLLESLFRGHGYETLTAKNGQEALELAEKNDCNLIISDILMPVMDGFTLCRECKKHPRLKHVPFIFYTATYTDQKDEEFALSLGADKFILKPQEPDTFMTLVADVLKDIKTGESRPPVIAGAAETVVLKEYNAALIRKLEDKMRQTEENEIRLKKYIRELEENIESRKKAEEALYRSEQLFRTLTETAPVGIFRTDIHGSTTYVNPYWCSISHMSRSEALNNGWLNAVHPDDRDRVAANWQKAVNAGDYSREEYRFLHTDGTVTWVSGQAVPHKDDQENLIGYIGIIYDITERRNAEEAIRKLNEELERRVEERTAQLKTVNQELEAFSYSVSHDLRTPLQIIDGYSSVLHDDFVSSPDTKGLEDIQRIRNAVKKMAALIDDLLKLSRISRAEISRFPVNLTELAEALIPDITCQEPDRKIQWEIEKDLRANCDSKLIQIVLTNLFCNAVKFTRHQPHPIIEFKKTTGDGETVFWVRDNGAGFDTQYAYKLFNAFERLHKTSEFEGSGIGLATVRRIIQKHGGRVWAEGAVNRGATFYFTL